MCDQVVNCLLNIKLEVPMKYLTGALVLLLVAVGFLGWRLNVASAEVREADLRASTAASQLEEQKREGKLLGQRLDALDAAMQGLNRTTADNNRKLGQTLTAINQIQKTEGDTDESISCLDVRVPRQLDDSMQ